MEKPNRNSSGPEGEDATVVIAPGSDNCDAWQATLESLPLKDQARYKFIRSIGFGGMKGVLLVHDADTGRDVAMAIMPDFRDRPRRDLNRFVREARITAQLEHPNIVPVHDIGIDGSGSPFFTMKYLRGRSLSAVLHKLHDGDRETREAFPRERLLQILMRVCNAAAFAHSQGICHLDLKPGNIHCGDFGEVQVLDWGIAAASDDEFESGTLLGTPGYIAPEVIRSGGKERPGPAADIYALGVILYAILAYETPFAGMAKQEILRRTAAGRFLPPSAVKGAPTIPPGLEAVCLKAMAPEPSQRYASATELRMELTACLSGFPTQAENASIFRSFLLFLRRHAAKVLIAILILLVALLGLQVLYYYHRF